MLSSTSDRVFSFTLAPPIPPPPPRPVFNLPVCPKKHGWDRYDLFMPNFSELNIFFLPNLQNLSELQLEISGMTIYRSPPIIRKIQCKSADFQNPSPTLHHPNH